MFVATDMPPKPCSLIREPKFTWRPVEHRIVAEFGGFEASVKYSRSNREFIWYTQRSKSIIDRIFFGRAGVASSLNSAKLEAEDVILEAIRRDQEFELALIAKEPAE